MKPEQVLFQLAQVARVLRPILPATYGAAWVVLAGVAAAQTTFELPSLDLQPDDGLTVRIGGTTPGLEHDLYKITGNAQLEGRLTLPFINDYVPQDGDVIEFLEAQSIEQRFRSHFFPIAPPDDVAVRFTQTPTHVSAEFVGRRFDNDFIGNQPTSFWNDLENWSLGELPDSTNSLTLQNGSTNTARRVRVVGGPQQGVPPAAAHELELRGNSLPMILEVVGDAHFTASLRTTVEDAGRIELNGGLLATNQLLVTPGGSVFMDQGRIRTGTDRTQVAGTMFGTGVVVGGLQLQEGGLLDIQATTGGRGGTMLVEGDYVQAPFSRLEIDIAAGDPGDFERLRVAGDASLDGTLEVNLSEFASFDVGTSVEFLNLISGQIDLATGFRQLQVIGNLPQGVYAGVQYSTTSAAIVGHSVGDMNGDFLFDEADVDLFILALRDREAYELTELPGGGIIGISADITGDTDYDGDLDFDDIDEMIALLPPPAALYAQQALLGVAIPEPATAWLAGLACLCWRWKRNQ